MKLKNKNQMIGFYLFFISIMMVVGQPRAFSKGQKLSVDHYDQAAYFLMLVADQEIPLRYTCGISSAEALNLLRPLHALIDQSAKIKNSADDKKVVSKKQMLIRAKKTSSWFCQSKLLKKLREEFKLYY